jgi:hypothetical protein
MQHSVFSCAGSTSSPALAGVATSIFNGRVNSCKRFIILLYDPWATKSWISVLQLYDGLDELG